MLVLALDTATPAVTAGVVELTADGCVPRSAWVAHDARKHAELLMPGIVAACDEAGVALAELAAVVTGAGPGPFTGLRVGMVTAAALGDALGVPVHGVCSLDAIAADTDGVDGQEEIAGAQLSPDSLARAWALGMRPKDRLADNDGHGFFQALGDSLVTGPTLTNVNDFRAVLIDPPARA